MRILSVHLKNLNSLSGEWHIDFTDPAYAAGGIFAITGPTGAGKSTILDAICLALYGRTPRLGKISKGANEIMARHSGECFAEVSFVSQKGQFRCHWSQHRARRQSSGELQLPRHEIADALSGKILSSSVRGVAEEIEVATGMDFDRFTRSMLLAQGGFAAFLQAAPDERAPVLEQITGTEIYSRISMKVHELKSIERARLHNLQAELAGMQLLPEEEEQALRQELIQQEQAEQALAGRLAQRQQALAWREGLQKLEEDLRQLGERQQQWQIRQQAFAPQQQRLDLAMRALELAASHAALSALRREQVSDQQALAACQQALPAKRKQADETLARQQAAALQRETAKAAWQEAQPLLQEVRALDVRLAAAAGPIATAEQAGQTLAAKLEQARAAHGQDLAELSHLEQKRAQVNAQLGLHGADARLVEQLADLRSRFSLITEQAAQLGADEKKHVQSEQLLKEAEQSWLQAQAREQAAVQRRDASQQLFKEQQAAWQEILAGQDLASWRRQQQELASQHEDLTAAQGEARAMLQAQAMQIELAGQSKILQAEIAHLGASITKASEHEQALVTERDLLETQLSLLQRIEALEDARQHLQDGEPCPLCGALEHPFALGNVPAADASRVRLAELRADLHKLAQETGALHAREAKLSLQMEQIRLHQEEQQQKEVEARARLAALSQRQGQEPAGLQWPEPAAEALALIEARLEQTGAALNHSLAIVQRLEALSLTLQNQQEELGRAKDAAMAAEREAVQAGHRYEQASGQARQQGEQLAQARERQEKALQQVRAALEPYNLPASLASLPAPQAGKMPDAQGRDANIPIANMLADIGEHLQERLAQWKNWQAEKEAYTLAIARLEEQTRQQKANIAHMEEECRQQQAQLGTLRQEREAIADKRRELFAVKEVESEEARLQAAQSSAEQALEQTSIAWQGARQECDRLEARAAELASAMRLREGGLTRDEAAFCRSLQEPGFADEAAYLAACLPEQERQQLARQSQELHMEQAELARRLVEQSALLQEEQERELSPQGLSELREAQAASLQEQRQLQQELGATRQRLAANEESKNRQQERAQAIAAQERVSAEWDLLHELIGSSDGKKYRNFAQGLTFELMISHANRQLQKMSDRYLLIHDAQQPLVLNVIDNYQAGEIRSTKNLSGGESFMVSLALALGLSSMASQKVRVDSLFLDEGFGSLDEDSLDIALETLAGLRQEGKLIGVISHVQALQERIPTRIRVEPLNSGKSRIIGPGCERLQ